MRDGVLHVEGVGFVTRSMVEEALAPLTAGTAGTAGMGSGSALQPRIVVDLRNVSGYEAACVAIAREWLGRARGYGVERIAFIANSSVVQTAVEVVARHLRAPLETFDSIDAARAWATESRICTLTTRDTVTAPRPRA